LKKLDIDRLIRPNIKALRAYEAKEIPCKVKLDANESPYGFGIKTSVLDIPTNRYPDPEAKTLRSLLAKDHNIESKNIILGNGSDELIYYLITVFGGPVLFPVPTFSMYGIISKAIGERVIPVPLDTEFDLDLKAMEGAIKKYRPKLIFLSSPNNPTGNCFSSERILKIIGLSKGIVVVDEAYAPFSSKMGFVPLIRDYENLLILRTLSKIGLAGIRLGYLIGKDSIIDEINKVRLPFNINSYSQAIAISAIKDKASMRKIISEIVSERERLAGELQKIKSIVVFPSEANFILFKVKNPSRLYNGLLKRGVLVRDMKGVVDSCLRVTVGTKRENNIFLKALKEVIE